MIKIATWNVNSLNVRLPHVLDWLTENEADILALQELKITIETKAGEQDKLFGSITSEDIRKALSEKGFDIDKKKIKIKEAIRNLGEHNVTLELYPQVKTVLSIDVIGKA